MNINVRFNDQTKMLNLNCKCGVILEHVRMLGNISPELLLDLCDKEGNVKLLRSNLTSYANSFLNAGETYFLVSATEDPKQYTYQLLVTLNPDEHQIDVKPTKPEKKEVAKKPQTKTTGRNKKSSK